MSKKYVHKPLCPYKPGDKVKWIDADGEHLKRFGIYTVTAVNGHNFQVAGCSVVWGFEITQFERVV